MMQAQFRPAALGDDPAANCRQLAARWRTAAAVMESDAQGAHVNLLVTRADLREMARRLDGGGADGAAVRLAEIAAARAVLDRVQVQVAAARIAADRRAVLEASLFMGWVRACALTFITWSSFGLLWGLI